MLVKLKGNDRASEHSRNRRWPARVNRLDTDKRRAGGLGKTNGNQKRIAGSNPSSARKAKLKRDTKASDHNSGVANIVVDNNGGCLEEGFVWIPLALFEG